METIILILSVLFVLSFVANIFLIKVAKDDKIIIDLYHKGSIELHKFISVLKKECDMKDAKIKNLKKECDSLYNQLNIKNELWKRK